MSATWQCWLTGGCSRETEQVPGRGPSHCFLFGCEDQADAAAGTVPGSTRAAGLPVLPQVAAPQLLWGSCLWRHGTALLNLFHDFIST